MNASKTNWLLDAGLFIGFMLSFLLDLTGLGVHQWLGVAVAAIGGIHLWRHRDWVVSVTRRLFGRTSSQARLYYWIDVALFAGLGFVAVSGLLISSWFNLSLSNYDLWSNLHITVSVMTLPILVLKIALHARWIIQVAQKHIFKRASSTKRLPNAQPAHLDRREFVKLMGLVGGAATFAAAGVLRSDAASQAGSTTGSTAADSSTGTTVQSSSSSSACTSSCPKGKHCSYPGDCRRYTDSNQNNRCDYGECT